jgi:hypothetical protein
MADESQSSTLNITSHRGGYNDTDPPNQLAEDECFDATNVEFFNSMLGERRNGTATLDLTSSGMTGESRAAFITQWFPTNVPTLPEFIAVCATPGSSVSVGRRDTGGTWHTLSPSDAIDNAIPGIFSIQSQVLNGKLFIAHKSSQNRLHLWDGTNWRRVGLAAPAAAPTAVDTATAGIFTGTRYYRVRVVEISGSTVIRRSEPGPVLTKAPSGSKNGLTVTKPTLPGEGETHWELEGSLDNANFYRVAQIVVATTTYDDHTASAKTYPAARGAGAPSSNDGTSITYVLLSNQAAALNLTGTVSNGTYSPNGTDIAGRGWIGYDASDTYIALGSATLTTWTAGTKFYASPDVATVLESSTVGGSGQDYSQIGTLSEAIGAYLTIQSARYMCVDGDRLIYGGHWTDTAQMSTAGWTPVTGDPGVGNTERAPIVTTGGTAITTQAFLDNFDNGPLTGLASTTFGAWYGFKWQGIYSAVRTNNPVNAYDIQKSNPNRGAIQGSVVKGADANGVGIIFFLDPFVGPCALLAGGVVKEIRGLRATWKRVNTKATNLVCCGCWYPRKQQLIWMISVDGGNSPSFGIRLQTSELQEMPDGRLGRGWSLITGKMAAAYCMAALTFTVGNLTTDVPFVGLASPDLFQQCDTGTDDNGTAFTGTVRGRPHYVAGLLQKWGTLVATLLGDADSQGSIKLNLIRNMGVETLTGSAQSLVAAGSETQVVVDIDNAAISEARCVQVELTDGTAGHPWSAQRLDIRPRAEERLD